MDKIYSYPPALMYIIFLLVIAILSCSKTAQESQQNDLAKEQSKERENIPPPPEDNVSCKKWTFEQCETLIYQDIVNQLGSVENALKTLSCCIKTHSCWLPFHLRYAQTLEKNGLEKEAMAIYEDIARPPYAEWEPVDHVNTLLSTAQCALGEMNITRNPEKAWALFKIATENQPGFGRPLYGMATISLMQKKYKNALKLLENAKIWNFSPNNVSLLMAKTLISSHKDGITIPKSLYHAEKILKDLKKKIPKETILYNLYASLHDINKNPKKAASERVWEEFYKKNKNWKKINKLFLEHKLKERSNDLYRLYIFSLISTKAKKDIIVGEFENALQKWPKDLKLHESRIGFLLAKKEDTLAEVHLNVALDIFPEKARFLTYKARLFENKKDDKNALETYIKAVRIAKLKDPGVLEEAARFIRHYTEKNPQWLGALHALHAILFHLKGQAEAAWFSFEKKKAAPEQLGLSGEYFFAKALTAYKTNKDMNTITENLCKAFKSGAHDDISELITSATFDKRIADHFLNICKTKGTNELTLNK